MKVLSFWGFIITAVLYLVIDFTLTTLDGGSADYYIPIWVLPMVDWSQELRYARSQENSGAHYRQLAWKFIVSTTEFVFLSVGIHIFVKWL